MTIDQAAHKQDRTLKLTVFGIIVFLFLVCIAAIALIWPIVQKTAFAPTWMRDSHRAEQLWDERRNEAETIIKSAIASAEAHHAGPYDMMNLHRTYAHLLYRANDWQEGDQQITIAIQACSNPPANLSEADALTHLYQERAWEAFQRHLKDPSQPAGAEDQEHSVEVADKAFGPDHEQTIYKIPTLALIYADIGEKDKADKLMQRAIDAVDHKASAKECAWFVYACDARLKASAKEYQAALKSFNHAFSVAADDGQKSRIFDDFISGFNTKSVVKDPDLKNAHSLLGREKFDELEKIADKLQKAETPLATAAWKLDSFYKEMLGDDELSEQDYRQNLLELKTWMNQKPNSSTARIAMAECLLDYAWFARGHGYSNSVTENGWKLFASRLEQSKFTLDQDSKIKAKSPRAYLEYARIALGRQLEKPLYLDLIDSCHKAWPKYHNIDISATNFLLPRWYGESGEVESFITKRADSIPGAKGDELYAQLIWSGADSLDNLFTPKSPLKWSRVQAGFKQIFKDFPDNMEARVVYLKMCRTANDSKAVEAVFDGMH